MNRRELLKLAACSALMSAVPLQRAFAAKPGKLIAATPLGLPQVILARALEDPELKNLIPERELRDWKDPDQLRAWLARAEVMVTATPTNVAANLYNRGVPVVLMNVNVWGTLGMLGLEQKGPLAKMEDLAGRYVGVPWRGDMPDLVFRYLLGKAGLEVGRDVKVSYQSSPFETVQMYVAQRLDAAVLPEPMRTATRLQSMQFGQSPQELDLQQEWARLAGGEPLLPQAGVLCRRELLEQAPEQVAALQAAIGRAVDWVVRQPEDAARLGADRSPLSRQVYEGAIARTALKMVNAQEARPALEDFFSALSELSSGFIGGKLPDADFYHV
ncbi:ABC transporter substrate-binding protein [Marinobacter nauticus]|uniref:ABC transporter substrate-binding protein n=1 Tax=Marinobacter nauticus TaxID=2743 RepID=UPI000EAE856D|nr:MqnA/MqnD/SBP family protein [Marinobacter nauticus]MBW3197127.1 ABC transporter substrate-binding protein [Marinobacter nauticus]MBY6182537.1 ABC transporter substrate-binding protein [Marinobacter nauticus]RKR77991.1 NitT/TauT family transport system substrate-binding protein [Marinobacter nauticus]